MKEEVDVLVIYPPRTATIRHSISYSYPGCPPVDTMALRVVKILKEAGFKTKYLPLFNLFYRYSPSDHFKEIIKYLKRFNPKIVLFQTDHLISNRNTACIPHAIKIGTYLKESNFNCKIAFAGKHATIYPKELIKNNCVDLVFRGECEEIIAEVFKKILDKKDLKNYPSILFKNNGELYQTSGYLYVKDINKLPVPDFQEITPYLEEISVNNNITSESIPITLRTSYGCPFRCIFCGGLKQWNHFRTRKSDKINEDINAAFNAFGKRTQIDFLDDELFTYDKEHLRDIIQLFEKKNLRINMVYAHVRYFNEEIAKILSRVTKTVAFGGENSCNRLLKMLNKNQKYEDLQKAIIIAKKFNLKIRLEWLVGLPEETENDVLENLNNIFRLIIEEKITNIQSYVLTPHPGTAIERFPQRYGIEILHRNWHNYLESGGYPVYSTKHLTSNQIYTYWLLTQMVIREGQLISRNLRSRNQSLIVQPPLKETFKAIFSKIN
ncbi:hypothetical protein BBF96_14810 [Anoxybacter fermentans]|uniref:Uncharacterized protein n=1 Tax=Anoxybacter fermentans TaxID=1323375 RepID=A0A3S9T218_9FIRM|nr:radical SAM protein [Anoxybacter fermentans]AZR74545.1 hypothetical protein BBF96_14810 [Anoxybacter fermentans]